MTTNKKLIEAGDRVILSNGKQVYIVNVSDQFEDTDGIVRVSALVEDVVATRNRRGWRYPVTIEVGA